MKVVLLAGGLGTRLSEETDIRPKPMVEIGGRPILWHIMKHYAHYGFKEFYIALGYKSEYIKKFFYDYAQLMGNMTIELKTGRIINREKDEEDWTVHLVDTGQDTLTGGRVKRLQQFLQDDTFMVTYGDGVSDIDLSALRNFHKKHGKIATVSAVRPPARFGGLVFEGDRVQSFTEKPQAGEGWINGGFLVFEPAIFKYLDGDQTTLERDPMDRLVVDNQLFAYRHEGFWQCMDTLRDKQYLNSLWSNGRAPWKVW